MPSGMQKSAVYLHVRLGFSEVTKVHHQMIKLNIWQKWNKAVS
jgi:hypothetical protein